MASSESIFPVRDDVEREPAPEPETMPLEEAGDVVAALTSETARTLVDHVYESPATTSDLAAAADTSVQNARYHLEQLQEAGLIEVVDTWYSSRGRDMDVYGPASDPLVIVAGAPDDDAAVERALSAAGTDREPRPS